MIPVSIRLHPIKQHPVSEHLEQVPWCATGRYLTERPIFTLDPHFHAGAYYVQEASSMFLAQLAPLIKEQKIRRILDLCAAPGGKATLLAQMLPSDGFLVANEVIGSRVAPLCENVAKWGYAHVAVTHNDAKDFARLPNYFDAIVVDAPCSGEGMFRKDPKAVEEWSQEKVLLCTLRQRRILGDVWGALRPGGYLIYSTCTFNRTENEENVDWMCTHLGAEKRAIRMNPEWGIVAQEGCYRFDPERLKGEGFFFALLQKVGEKISTFSNPLGVKSVAPVNKHLTPTEWLPDGFNLFTKGDLVKALPIVCASEVVELESLLRVVQSGVAVARKKGNDWVPEADLALSLALRADAFPVAEVDLTMARRYLSRETISINDAQSGYLLIQYQNSRLGFVKNIGTRINNLYPPSRRIRMGV